MPALDNFSFPAENLLPENRMEKNQQGKELESAGQHIKNQNTFGKRIQKTEVGRRSTSSRPGPMLLNVAATAVKLVIRS